jgi:hypothetical protein
MAQTATSLVRGEPLSALPRAGTVYAIKELAKRAGVTAEFFDTWRIEFEDAGYVSVCVRPGTKKRLRFPRPKPEFWGRLHAGVFRTATAGWPATPPRQVAELVPDFRIPFSSSERDDVGPIFAAAHQDCLECPVDLPTSALLTLSRFEETLPVPRDEHGRFEACSSIASRGGFLHRAVVDEYGLAFADALTWLLPRWQPAEPRLRVKLGHDVDEIGLPFNFHSAVAHTLRRGRPAATLRDLWAPLTRTDTTYQKLLREMVRLSAERGLDSTVYWKCSAKGPHDTGYDPHHPRIRAHIEELRARGVNLGIHPGYETFESPKRFLQEVGALIELLGDRHVGGRQDFLRWKPETWAAWEAAGLAYDASVGFADRIGFRAGTSHAYRPWLLAENREAHLLEIPIVAMDSTLQGYMKLDSGEALTQLRACVARCRLVGGIFHLVWHNTAMRDARYARIYRTLLDELAGSDAHDWKTQYHDAY